MKANIKFTGLMSDGAEGLHIAEQKGWQCTLGDDDKSVPLCYIMEVIDMHGATGEAEFKKYPYLVSIGMMAVKPHKSFYEGEGKADRLSTIYDCNSYMGSVPVDHKLIQTDSLNKKIMSKLKSGDACLVTQKPQFGTFAAQNGKGAEFQYPQFKTAEAAYEFGKQLIENYGNVTMTLCGFLLDQPINMMGETGWKTIETQVNGRK